MSDKGKPNRLISEKSPYLLQHAHNPVDWYPWGEEAFFRARTEDKPIFLSIGYSTCHWCHVMAHESFEDHVIAEILNSGFISVKVDREERPDVDHVYMAACQAATGSGGWPLTLVLDSAGRPFFAGTYLPKSGHWGKPGLLKVLENVQKQWREKRKDLLAYAEKLTSFLREAQDRRLAEAKVSPELLQKGFDQLSKSFDRTYGGFGKAPKFPTPHNLLFLLTYFKRTQDREALSIVEKTLAGMRAGGIYDHVGYGFARYSVDEKWITPHFEKMLYDNALLGYTFLSAAEATGDGEYSRVAEEIIEYVLRDLCGKNGEFFSAEDADSEGCEGFFYTWTEAELVEALGVDKAALFGGYYHVTAKGNFEHGTNILHTVGNFPADYAGKNNLSETEFLAIMEECRKKLFVRRSKRKRPFCDDKVLTGWNALMAVTLAKASRVMKHAAYRVAAEKCLDFLEKNLTRQDGRLMGSCRNGVGFQIGYLDDYAFLLWAYLEMYESAPRRETLSKARSLADEMIRLFWDGRANSFFMSGSDSEELLIRPREWVDAALPAGNSVAALMLIRMTQISGQEEYREISRRLLEKLAGELSRSPMAYTYLLTACDELLATGD